MKKHMLLVIGSLLLASLACSYVSRLVGGDNPVPAAPEQPSNVLFQDDFSNPSSGWDQFSDVDGLTNYENGVYRIRIDKPDFTFWANPGLDGILPSDVRIEVDATKAGGPDFNDFGIICRYSGLGGQASFYEFIISSDGFAGIVLVTENSQQVISGDGELQPFDAIRQGSATNHIQAECSGSQLTLYVNGVVLTSVSDTTLANGDVGLLASTYDEAGVDILFDNFFVTVP
jgi:hypothetical protein